MSSSDKSLSPDVRETGSDKQQPPSKNLQSLAQESVEQRQRVLDLESQRSQAAAIEHLPELAFDAPQDKQVAASESSPDEGTFDASCHSPGEDTQSSHGHQRFGDLETLFDQNVSRLDADHNSFVSELEISAAQDNPMFTGADRQLLTALQQYGEQIQTQHDDEIGPEDSGITAADISMVDIQRYEVLKNFGPDFERVDQDGNGSITESEIESKLHSASRRQDTDGGAYLRGLQTLQLFLSSAEEASNDEWGNEDDGITRADLRYFENIVLGIDTIMRARGSHS